MMTRRIIEQWDFFKREWTDNEYQNAWREHIFLLRCEGLTLREIGKKHCGGLTIERVRQQTLRFGRRLDGSMLRTRVRAYFPDDVKLTRKIKRRTKLETRKRRLVQKWMWRTWRPFVYVKMDKQDRWKYVWQE